MTLRALLRSVCLFVALDSAAAETPQLTSGLDFLVDWEKMKGKLVRVDECVLHAADTLSVLCSVYNRGVSIGNVSLNSQTLERESFRRALQTCPGNKGHPRAECRVSVVGVVNPSGRAELHNATINWQARP
jgi:hypothetical protein